MSESAIRTIQYSVSLDQVDTELAYTWARLLKSPHTHDLAVEIEPLLTRCDTLTIEQRKLWRDETAAQAGVDEIDDALDDTCTEVVEEVRHKDRKSRGDGGRLKPYLGSGTVHEIVRLGLDSQIRQVATWPGSLKGEDDPELKAMGLRVVQHITDGNAALDARVESAGRTAQHRARSILPLIDDMNSVRRTLLGRLVQRAEEKKLPPSWPFRFFKKTPRVKKPASVKRDPTPEEDG